MSIFLRKLLKLNNRAIWVDRTQVCKLVANLGFVVCEGGTSLVSAGMTELGFCHSGMLSWAISAAVTSYLILTTGNTVISSEVSLSCGALTSSGDNVQIPSAIKCIDIKG